MTTIVAHEFDILLPRRAGAFPDEDQHPLASEDFAWLETQALLASAASKPWIRLVQKQGRKAVQLMNFVGVVRTPSGQQLEVLPKIGKRVEGGPARARKILLDMLCCLRGFRHIQSGRAELLARRMPLPEIFISEFLRAVDHVVKRGLRSDYSRREDNLTFLRGKLIVSAQLRQNLLRPDRFFADHDEFTANRPENRLLHLALDRALHQASSQENQRLARELRFVFADLPRSTQVDEDFRRVRLDRGMGHYEEALGWARLILGQQSPLTGSGVHEAPSLMFPMDALFEAYVAKHLPAQLVASLTLKGQARSRHLVRHGSDDWFLMKPDLLIRRSEENLCVLDTKWKLLDSSLSTTRDKYELSQDDFYQLHAYGHGYLAGRGDVILIYPKTQAFKEALPAFDFLGEGTLRLWVVPFCLDTRSLLAPAHELFPRFLRMPCERLGLNADAPA